MENKELNEVNTTVKVEVADVLILGNPILSHKGVKITPPPSPRSPPMNPAIAAPLED